jgi:hypothetical protein
MLTYFYRYLFTLSSSLSLPLFVVVSPSCDRQTKKIATGNRSAVDALNAIRNTPGEVARLQEGLARVAEGLSYASMSCRHLVKDAFSLQLQRLVKRARLCR